MITLISFLIVLGLCVTIHEWGHFIAARKTGVHVITFSIGFGPSLLKWMDKKGTLWKIGILPLGGYVQLLSQEDSSIKPAQKNKTFESKKPLQKIWIAGNGVVFNFILAFVLIFGIFSIHGLPQNAPIINQVVKDSPAEKTGLKSGDEIIKTAGISVKSFQEIKEVLSKTTGIVELHIRRNKEIISLKITPDRTEKIPTIGIQAHTNLTDAKKVSLPTAFLETFHTMIGSVSSMFNGLIQIISGERSSKELGGIMSIAEMAGQSFETGFSSFLFFIAFISINLGMINLFPIPGLDGGQIVFFVFELITRKPAPKTIQTGLTYAGFGFLIFLMIFATYNDIIRLL